MQEADASGTACVARIRACCVVAAVLRGEDELSRSGLRVVQKSTPRRYLCSVEREMPERSFLCMCRSGLRRNHNQRKET